MFFPTNSASYKLLLVWLSLCDFRYESLLSAAIALIATTDQIDWQANGLLDLAEVRELAGAPADAAALSERAARRFERKGNVVSALRARQHAERLRATAVTS